LQSNTYKPLKQYPQNQVEIQYAEKQLSPAIEKEIKEGFFEIRKKFDGVGDTLQEMPEEVQVYVSHLCLQNYHPIFCKFELEAVKTFLSCSQIVYLNKMQTLFDSELNTGQIYIILFGKLKLQTLDGRPLGQTLNIGWTAGEEILFKSTKKDENGFDHRVKQRRDTKCFASTDSCVLGFEKKALRLIKQQLEQKGMSDEFRKLEVIIRGNYLVKKQWRQ